MGHYCPLFSEVGTGFIRLGQGDYKQVCYGESKRSQNEEGRLKGSVLPATDPCGDVRYATCFRIPGTVLKPLEKRRPGSMASVASWDATHQWSDLSDSDPGKDRDDMNKRACNAKGQPKTQRTEDLPEVEGGSGMSSSITILTPVFMHFRCCR